MVYIVLVVICHLRNSFSCMVDMEASLLYRLPAELRDLVYEYVFESKYAIKLEHGSIQHPLTKTCRQLRAETLPMYYSMTRFNAHLDDGPATRLCDWLKTLGSEQCLLLREVNMWDLHNLVATFHGRQASKEKLLSRELEDGEKYALDTEDDMPVGTRPGSIHEDVTLAFRAIGLDLRSFYTTKGGQVWSMTSNCAIVPQDERRGVVLSLIHI